MHMIILIEIMKDKWKSLSELDIVTGLDMGWCSELRLLVLHNSYLYCLYTTTTTTKKKKYKPRTNKQIAVSYKEKKTPKSQKLASCMCGCLLVHLLGLKLFTIFSVLYCFYISYVGSVGHCLLSCIVPCY